MSQRRSAKQEVRWLMNHLMETRPRNHPRVVIELQTLAYLCRQMGWETMRDQISQFVATIDSEVFTQGLMGGTENVAKERQG